MLGWRSLCKPKLEREAKVRVVTLRREATIHQLRQELTRSVSRPPIFLRYVRGILCTVPSLLVVSSVSVRLLKPLPNGISRRAWSVAGQWHIYGHGMQCPLRSKYPDFYGQTCAIACQKMRTRCIGGEGSGSYKLLYSISG